MLGLYPVRESRDSPSKLVQPATAFYRIDDFSRFHIEPPFLAASTGLCETAAAMPDEPHELQYADGRRRSRWRWTMLALVLSALACGVVGRLLYARVAPGVSAWLALSDAQRRIDTLSVHGNAYDADALRPPPATKPANAIESAASAYLLARDGAVINPDIDAVVFAGRLKNMIGERRFVILRIARSRAVFVDGDIDVATLVVDVAGPAGMSGRDPATRTDILPFATFRTLRVEPPTIDPNDPRRIVIHGTRDGEPFARELTLDVDDRAQLHEVSAPTTRRAS